jgi:ADP-ribose pyrophosphatase YjhB (NUDIX family)
MADPALPPWLAWVREIEALCQSGLTYGRDPFDVQRYERLLQIAAEILQQHTHLPVNHWLEDFSAQQGYATPKVDVRGAVIHHGEILLVKERADGRWCMPGGWADVGDSPSATVTREVREESGYEVLARKVIGVYDANRSGRPLSLYHAYKVVFLCELTGGQPQPSDETAAVGFFSFDALPPLSANRTDERHLSEVKAHWIDGARPTAFD